MPKKPGQKASASLIAKKRGSNKNASSLSSLSDIRSCRRIPDLLPVVADLSLAFFNNFKRWE